MNDYLPEGVTKELYPFTGKYHTTASGARLHYLDEGSGRPIVMLHGNPTWSFYFRNLVKELSGNNRVIVPDHIGCGLSDKPGDDKYDYTLKSRADDVESLLESLGITSDVTLVLHDWGGMIGLGRPPPGARQTPGAAQHRRLLPAAGKVLPARHVARPHGARHAAGARL